MFVGRAPELHPIADRPDQLAARANGWPVRLNPTKEGQRRSDRKAVASCASSFVCPPSANKSGLPCLTAHFVRRPALRPSAISSNRSLRRFEPREERSDESPA